MHKKVFLYTTFQECESLLYHLSQIKTFFSINKYTIAAEIKDADVIFLAGCVAGQEMEEHFLCIYNTIKEKYPEKMIIPTGCVVDYRDDLNGIGPGSLKLLDRWFKHEIGFDKVETEILDSIFSLGSIAFHRTKDYYIQISQGCAGNCSFCATKKVKGFVFSNSEDRILQKITKLKHERSASRFVLLSDDCGSYGLDKKTNIAKLLNRLITFKDTFFSLNFFEPSRLKQYFNEIDEHFWEKAFFVNVPIQSTSNRIIKLMNRNYLVSDIFKLVRRIKTLNPHITIATCIMFSVPSETKQEFDSLIECDYPFDKIIFFPFSSRPGTLMEKMKQIPVSEKERRINVVRDYSERDNRVGIMEPDLHVKFYS